MISNNDGDDVISIHYCHDAPPPFTFFMGVTAFDTETGYEIIAATRKWFIMILFNSSNIACRFCIVAFSGLALNSLNTHMARKFRDSVRYNGSLTVTSLDSLSLECDSPDGDHW